MKPFTVLWDIVSLLNILTRGEGLDEGKRILEGKIDYLRARLEDIERAFFSAPIPQGKKRKRNGDPLPWVTEGWELVQEGRRFLGQGEEACPKKKKKLGEATIFSSTTCAELVIVLKLNKTLSAHEKEVDMLLSSGLSDVHRQSPDRGNLIPVRNLFGKVTSDAFQQLQALLQGDEVGRIAIHGIEGIGKTYLMKHLHNSALKWVERFDYVFWVTFPHQFSIRHVQDAVAAAVKCDLPSDDDLNLRAKKLSDTLAGLGSFVLYLDDVPEVHFSLVQIGIPVPAEGSKSKLVLTTRSAVVSKLWDCSRPVKLDRLSDIEAAQLLTNEANSSLTSVSILLAKMCHGVPREIVDIATRMRGIDDPCEWRNALFERVTSIPFQAIIDELETLSEQG